MSTAPRVLHVSQPTTAGVPHVVEALVRDQVEHGWQVHVACPGDGYLADRARAAGAEVHVWKASREPGPATLRETASLRGVVRSVDPMLLHLHSSKAGLAGRLAVRGRTPTVFQPHSWSFLAVEGMRRMAARRWERWASVWATAIICVSDDEAREGREVGVQTDIQVIPNGVDVPDQEIEEPSAARARVGLSERPTAVCVGRLARQKGQDRLLDVWSDVLRAVPDAQLVLVGDGPQRAALEKHAERTNGIVLVGQQDDVMPWLAAGDVVVLPSRWEAGLTLTAMEAMAVGRSVVATRFEGLAAALPADAGAVVAQDDGAALKDALVGRLCDRTLARAEGAAGRRFVTASRRWATTTDAVRSLYANLQRGHA